MYNIFICKDFNKIDVHLKRLTFKCYTYQRLIFEYIDKVSNGETIQSETSGNFIGR